MNMRWFWKDLTVFERVLWLVSVGAIASAGALAGGDPLSVLASLVGVTSLLFVAKGYVCGQILMVIFSVMYGVISLVFRYYGEMITYLGMTAPMAVVTSLSGRGLMRSWIQVSSWSMVRSSTSQLWPRTACSRAAWKAGSHWVEQLR